MTFALRHRPSIRTSRRISDAALTAVVFVLAIAAPAQAAGLRLGFFDGSFMGDQGTRAVAFTRASSVGGTIVRLSAAWNGIAPRQPAHPADPSDPAYQWGSLDAAVHDAVQAGLTPLVTINAAPAWAEGPNRAPDAGVGTWRPNAGAFRQFARAIALRYSGRLPGIPRVRYWQIWNEPNLATYLTPQWVRSNGRWVAASPAIFRGLVNAGYAGIKSVFNSNFVVSAGTAPYGDLVPGGRRISPVTFLRDVLSKRTNLDAISHHPYGVGSPYQHAFNPPDVAVPDIYKLRAVLKAAARKGHVNRHAQIWVTEMSWDSNPPDPDGVPERTQADWLQEGLNVLWKQGVTTVTWFLVTDEPPVPSYAATNQGGVFLLDGQPKLSATAFRFPFIAPLARGGGVSLWGRAPTVGRLLVQVLRGRSWKTVWTKRVGSGAVFSNHLAGIGRGARLRAQQGGVTSLVWTVR